MKSVEHKELEKLIRVAYDKKVPFFVWGAPGIGKSESVRRVAKEIAVEKNLKYGENGLNENDTFCLIDVRISQLDPSDLRGLPSINDGVTRWLPPSWLPKSGQGIIFFDELNLAPPSIQASAYQLILDRRLGEYRLPDGYVIVSAGNRLEDRANVFELPAPLANRFTHIELQIPSKDVWTDWALSNGIDSRIVSFIQFKPSMIFKFDSKMKDKAYPTPRSWAFCSKLISDIKSGELGFLGTLAASAVGEGTSIEFGAFMKLQRSIDIKDILKNPEKVKDINEIDLKYSLLSSVSEYYRDDRKILEKILVMCQYLEPEFAILLLRFTRAIDEPYLRRELPKLKTWIDLSSKYAKYILT